MASRLARFAACTSEYPSGSEPARELVPLLAARPALAVAHVVPRVHRDVLRDQRLVELFEPPQMLVQPVRPQHHRGGGGRDFVTQPVGAQPVGEPCLGVDAHAPVRLAREAPLLNTRHGGCERKYRATFDTRTSGFSETEIGPSVTRDKKLTH